MSEYQYYEFQAIDQSLTDRQMRELRAVSSRAKISRTTFSNYYTYGDLKASPSVLLTRYFDASFYFAHWHFVEVAFRFPKSAIDLKLLRRYRAGQALDVRSSGPHVVITVSAEREDFDPEEDGQGWLSSLIPLRALVASGDERALYLAWLLGVQYGEIAEGAREPSRPDGLGTLPPALESFITIVGLDPDLVAAAAEGSAHISPALSAKSLDRWIATLTEREKAALLSRVTRGETAVGSELLYRFRRQHAPPRSASASLRTVAALVARSSAIAEQRRQSVVARETKERARRERSAAAARERDLTKLAKRQTEAWRRVETLISTKRPGDYDAAIALLKDLHEIGQRKGGGEDVAKRIRALREKHAQKPSLLARLRSAGL